MNIFQCIYPYFYWWIFMGVVSRLRQLCPRLWWTLPINFLCVCVWTYVKYLKVELFHHCVETCIILMEIPNSFLKLLCHLCNETLNSVWDPVASILSALWAFLILNILAGDKWCFIGVSICISLMTNAIVLFIYILNIHVSSFSIIFN